MPVHSQSAKEATDPQASAELAQTLAAGFSRLYNCVRSRGTRTRVRLHARKASPLTSDSHMRRSIVLLALVTATAANAHAQGWRRTGGGTGGGGACVKPSCSRTCDVAVSRRWSEGERRAKGPVGLVVSRGQKTFYYRLLPQPRYGQAMSSLCAGRMKKVSAMPTSISTMLPRKGSCQLPVWSIK